MPAFCPLFFSSGFLVEPGILTYKGEKFGVKKPESIDTGRIFRAFLPVYA
jgi:hypothetical protein